MKKIILLFLLFIFLGSAGMTQALKKKYPKPTIFHKRNIILISSKPRNYYELSQETASLISVTGPGKLHVYTRGRFLPGSGNTINYNVIYSIDGGDVKTFTAGNVERSGNDTYKDGKLGIPGKSKDFIIELSRGDHSIELKTNGTKFPVDARYIFTPIKEKKQVWISFSPMRPSEPVELISKENRTTYYRFSHEKPLKVEIIGPTELRVLTRIENHYTMKGRIHYRVQVKENSKVISTYQLSSERSDVTTYQDDADLVPGKACEFVIIVPKGTHIYEILALDEDKSTILGRLLLPKKDVKLMK